MLKAIYLFMSDGLITHSSNELLDIFLDQYIYATNCPVIYLRAYLRGFISMVSVVDDLVYVCYITCCKVANRDFVHLLCLDYGLVSYNL